MNSKKLLSILASFFFLCASAAQVEVDGIYYNLGTNTAQVTHYGEGDDGWIGADVYDLYTGHVNIPSSISYNGKNYTVTSVGQDAFAGSKLMVSLTLPSTVTSIGNNAFTLCQMLEQINVDEGNTAFASHSGILYTKAPLGIYFAPRSLKGDIEIIDGVATIPSSAFQYTKITSVTLPNTVTSIADGAFSDCTFLADMFLNEGLTTISEYAFSKCASLRYIDLPSTLKTIKSCAFVNCSSLEYVMLKEGVTSIGKMAFYSCGNLGAIMVPSSMTSIEENAFLGCDNLTTVNNKSLLNIQPGSTGNGYIGYYAESITANDHLFTNNGFCTHCNSHQPCDSSTVNAENVYQISNAGQLFWFACKVNGGNTTAKAVLTADIDLDKHHEWVPIGNATHVFSGSFSGQRHAIRGLHLNQPAFNYAGLFGYTGSSCAISNLAVLDCNVGAQNHVGSLCGHNGGTIANCYCSGSVNGNELVGGICGSGNGTIHNCFSICKTDGNLSVGGVCGDATANTSNCFFLTQGNLADAAATAMDDNAFTNGSVAYLLQNGTKDKALYSNWGQLLGEDLFPAFTDDTVYQYTNCQGSTLYTNNGALEDKTNTHDWTEWTTTPSTCSTKGERTHHCLLDATHTETEQLALDPNAHAFDNKVLSETPNAKGLYAYVCDHNNTHMGDYTIIKNYNGKDNLELYMEGDEYHVLWLELEDGVPFYSPVNFMADELDFYRTLNKDTITFMVPFDVPLVCLWGTAYVLKSFDGKDLHYSQVEGSEAPANTPYLLANVEKGENILEPMANVEIKATTHLNDITAGKATQFGVFEKSVFSPDANYDYYAFQDNRVYRATNSLTVNAYRTGLRLAKNASTAPNKPTNNSAAMGIVLDAEETGCIFNPADICLKGKVDVYDTLGRAIRTNADASTCMKGLKAGIYIVNGKKVAVRNK